MQMVHFVQSVQLYRFPEKDMTALYIRYIVRGGKGNLREKKCLVKPLFPVYKGATAQWDSDKETERLIYRKEKKVVWKTYT
jgi:hypothetical protein